MFGKLFFALLIYLGFVMIRGMWQTYKLLKSGKIKTGQFRKQNEKDFGDDKNTFEADYKIEN